MATTTLTLKSNRLFGAAYLEATVTGVAVDAAAVEQFRLPTGFGDLFIDDICVTLGALSGAYVAPAPADDGPFVGILSSDAATSLDFIGAKHWTNASTTSARPVLVAWMDPNHRTIQRQDELIQIAIPIIAGAGVTASITLRMRGRRLRQP